MTPSTRATRIGANLAAEVKARAKQRAEAVFGPVPAGTTELSPTAFMDMVRRNWPDPGYRNSLLTNVGPENFRHIVIEPFGGNEAVWPDPEGEPPKSPPTKPSPPMSDYQAQNLQDTQAKLLLEAQGGTHG